MADNLNMFVKKEPHKISKIKDGRYRLICGFSLVDAMVDRILFGWFADKVLANVGKTGIRVGWSHLYGGWRELVQEFYPSPVACIDKSSWDWTLQEWIVDIFYYVIADLAEDAPRWYLDLVFNRLVMVFKECKFEFQDGQVVKQQGIGIMKSGFYLTIILNSIAQMALHVAAGLRVGIDVRSYWPECLGDDTVQPGLGRLTSDYVRELESLGCVVKGCKVMDYVEFAGLQMNHKRVVPAYWKKHLFKCCYHDAETFGEFLYDMQVLYHYSPEMVRLFRSAALAKGLNDYLVPWSKARDLVG